MAAIAGRRSVRSAFMIRRNPRRGLAVTARTSPRRHVGVIERRGRPRTRRMTGITGSRRRTAFVTRWNTRRHRPVVARSAGRRCHGRVTHSRRFPCRCPMAAIAGRRSVRSAFMIRRNPRRGLAVTARTSPRRYPCMVERRRLPRCGSMTAVASGRGILTALVICRNPCGSLSVTGRTSAWRHTCVVERDRPPSRGPVTTVAGPRSHPAFVACRNTRRKHAMTGRAGSRLHRAVVIPAGHQPPRSPAFLMARIAGGPATIHVPRWLSLRYRSVMTARTGSRKYSVVRKKCGGPIGRAVATVTVDAGR